MSGGSQKNSSWLRSFRCQAPFIHIPGYPWSIHHFLGAARIPLTRNIFVENGTLLLPQEESTHLRKWPRSIREMWNTQCRILELKKLACRKIANWWLVTILKAAFGAQKSSNFHTFPAGSLSLVLDLRFSLLQAHLNLELSFWEGGSRTHPFLSEELDPVSPVYSIAEMFTKNQFAIGSPANLQEKKYVQSLRQIQFMAMIFICLPETSKKNLASGAQYERFPLPSSCHALRSVSSEIKAATWHPTAVKLGNHSCCYWSSSCWLQNMGNHRKKKKKKKTSPAWQKKKVGWPSSVASCEKKNKLQVGKSRPNKIQSRANRHLLRQLHSLHKLCARLEAPQIGAINGF